MKSITLLLLHGNYTLIDQFVKMAKVLVLFLFLFNGAEIGMSSRLDFSCTNNQIEYEALLFGLIMLRSIEVKHVEAYGNSLLVVQQVASEFQCLEGSLRACLDACLNVVDYFAEFSIFQGMKIKRPTC